MKYTKEMEAKINELGLKAENILYLTIAREYMRAMISGEKKVEFRDLTDYYLKKLCNYDKEGNFLENKPIKALLLQGGYNPDSPRMLIEMKGWVGFTNEGNEAAETEKEENEIENAEEIEEQDANEEEPYVNPYTQLVTDESYLEGFTEEDEIIGLVLGEIYLREGI